MITDTDIAANRTYMLPLVLHNALSALHPDEVAALSINNDATRWGAMMTRRAIETGNAEWARHAARQLVRAIVVATAQAALETLTGSQQIA